ncbi:glycosyltransferase family 9 protein [Sinomonas terrae]|uniref:Glycosyltransferase family 9 protein n=1 Tax=Sinomonas terrae TaxID=2908838 RepID=A0ABS9TW20_9MICC|nr:glycosyltransferase family 9 protein [Sinomonas terrae]MCH6468616.1 glycosyltransferase family 9 protein [Sinomonas terrae]
MSSFRRILFVEVMGGLGDVVLALPAIHALALSHPDATVHVLTLEPWHVLLEGDPLIEEVIPLAGRESDDVQRAVREALASIRPDLSITTNRRHGLPELLESAPGVAVTNLWRSPPPEQRVDERYLELLARDGIIAPQFVGHPPRVAVEVEELEAGRELLSALVPEGRQAVMLVPDSGMAVKRWPQQHWARLASLLQAAGRTPVLVAEEPGHWPALSDAGAVPTPRLTLRQLAALYAAAAEREGVCVGGDTGPVRLATAAGMRAVGLYGPSVATRYGLHPDRGVSLQGLPECSVRHPANFTEQVCWWDARCPLADAGAGPACMSHIAPEAVASALGL